mgnify:FL=1
MNSALINKYLKADLFEELGMTNLTPEERVSFLERFGEALQYRLTFRMMKELSEENKGKLNDVLARNDSAEIVNFLSQALPNFSDIANEEVAGYKKELVERFKT